MIRGLVIVKAENVEQARLLAQQPPFSISEQNAASFLVPANPTFSQDGLSIISPATLYWASGLFEEDFWNDVEQAASVYSWGGAWSYDLQNDPNFPKAKLQEVISSGLLD